MQAELTKSVGCAGDVSIGDRLRRIRSERQMSQELLGGLIGVSGATVSRYESGQLQIGLDQVELLADALRVDPCDLACKLLRDDEPPAPTQQIEWTPLHKIPFLREYALRAAKEVYEQGEPERSAEDEALGEIAQVLRRYRSRIERGANHPG